MRRGYNTVRVLAVISNLLIALWVWQSLNVARLKSLRFVNLPELLWICSPILNLAVIFWPESEKRG
jgi:hypothetical protein